MNWKNIALLGAGAAGVYVISSLGNSKAAITSTPPMTKDSITMIIKGMKNPLYSSGGADALVYLSKGFNASLPWTLLIYVRGNNNNIANTMTSSGIGPQLDSSGKNIMMVLPERPPTGFGAGHWIEKGKAKAFVDEILTSGQVQVAIGSHRPTRIVAMSHSGGWFSIANALNQSPDLPIESVTLFDSLYGNEADFLKFAKSGKDFFSITGAPSGGTNQHNADLMAMMKNAKLSVTNWGTLTPDIIPYGVKIGFGKTAIVHDLIPKAFIGRFIKRTCI